jgi:hypothetical protein
VVLLVGVVLPLPLLLLLLLMVALLVLVLLVVLLVVLLAVAAAAGVDAAGATASAGRFAAGAPVDVPRRLLLFGGCFCLAPLMSSAKASLLGSPAAAAAAGGAGALLSMRRLRVACDVLRPAAVAGMVQNCPVTQLPCYSVITPA